MALPVLSKTYQFARANAQPTTNRRLVSTGSGLSDQRTVLLHIVNDMLSFPLSPYVVAGSSNSSAAGMDGVNRWTTIANLVFSEDVPAAHSWIVLEQPGINGGAQVCFDLYSPASYSGNAANGSTMAVFLSPSGLYTGGSTTARPTATDEVSIISSALSYYLDGGTSGASVARDYIVSSMLSTDGQVFRCLVRMPGNRFSVFFNIEVPRDPVSGWTNPVFARWLHGATSVPVYTNYNDGAYLLARAAGASMGLYVTCEGFVTSMAGQTLTTPNELSGEWEMYTAGLASTTVGARGRHGRIFDFYWISTSHSDGDAFPANGSRQWLCVGDIAIPWDGSIPVLA